MDSRHKISMLSRCTSILRLAIPVTISQLGAIIVGFADNIMVGHYSTEALASASFVVNIFNVAIFCLMGFSYGLTPLIGRLFPRKMDIAIGRTLRTGMIANVIVGCVITALMSIVYCVIGHLGQPEELLPIIRPFFLIVLASLIPLALFNTFSQWSYAIRNTSMPMWIMLGGNILNIAGNYMLIFGHCGMPELGLLGAGLSTLIARTAMAITIIVIFFTCPKYAGYRAGFMNRTPESAPYSMGKIVATSWPVALQMTFETCAFSLCAVFAGWLGTISLAAFQIIVVVSSLGFCIYYSIGTAIAVSVSNEAGQNSLSGCRQVAFDGYAVMLLFAAISTCIFIFFAPQLMGTFTSDSDVLKAAQALILPLALYQLGDATQVTFANALRGTSHVMPMLWISFFSYVIAGISSSYILAFPIGLGNYGIVLSFSVSLFMAATLFFRSFMRVTRTDD